MATTPKKRVVTVGDGANRVYASNRAAAISYPRRMRVVGRAVTGSPTKIGCGAPRA